MSMTAYKALVRRDLQLSFATEGRC